MGKTAKIERADAKLTDTAGKVADAPATKMLGKISEIADQPPLFTICGLTIAAGLIAGDARLARTGARMLAAEWLATSIKSAIKHRVDRVRPFAPGKTDPKIRRGGSSAKELSSFPSGHTAGAVAVSRAIARDYPEHAVKAYGAAAAVAAIQVPRQAHFASDVAAGALIGLVAEGVVTLAEVGVQALAGGERRSGTLLPNLLGRWQERSD